MKHFVFVERDRTGASREKGGGRAVRAELSEETFQFLNVIKLYATLAEISTQDAIRLALRAVAEPLIAEDPEILADAIDRGPLLDKPFTRRKTRRH